MGSRIVPQKRAAFDKVSGVSSTLYAEPLEVRGTAILRAVAVIPGEGKSVVVTRSYISVDSLLADGTLDERILDDPRYAGRLHDAFRAVPTVSLVGPESLLRAAIAGRLDAPVSMEFFDPRPEVPSEESTFQIDCGLESHSDSAPKRS